jgi:hypothetical protein
MGNMNKLPLLIMKPAAVTIVSLAVAGAALTQENAAKWPRALELENATVVVYQPQLEKLAGVILSGRAAFAWEAKGAAPVFGVFWFDARVLVDKDSRQVHVEGVTVRKVRLPNADTAQEQAVASVVEKEVPQWDLRPSLDEIQDAVAASERQEKTDRLAANPPKFVFSRDPAVLLYFDGAPIFRPIEKTKLERAVNTPLFVVRDPEVKRSYLAGGGFWYEAEDAAKSWTPVAAPSAAVKAYFDANPPPPPEPAPAGGVDAGTPKQPASAGPPPRIIVATEPTELIVFDGAPNYVPVGAKADLLYADNADGKVLVYTPANETYVLAAGRWYKAKSLDGPWTPVRPDKLPPAFAQIPPESGVGDVRVFVAGTPEAEDALADAQIPQTTAVKRDQTINVTYDGEPKFKKIEGTEMSYAVNTQFSVISDSGKYWACHQAVWYVAPTPKGPWTVSDRRPPSIDKVPPSTPVYNTKYVYVYQSTPEVVYVGYLPGYTFIYPYYGTVVYGTGYHYVAYVSPTVYYPPPATFGVSISYNPWMGWGVGISYGTPYFRVGVHFGGYPPYGGWYGPAGYRPPPYPPYGYRPPPPGYRPPGGYYPPPGYRPPAGSYPPGYRPPPGSTAPGNRPPSATQPIAGGNRPSQQPANIYNRPENLPRNASQLPATPSQRPATPSTRPNDVYGDRSGNVYRQTPGGQWEQNTKQGWQQQSGSRPAQGGASSGTPSASQRPASSGGSYGGGAHPSTGGAPAGLGRDASARGGGRGGARGGGRR